MPGLLILGLGIVVGAVAFNVAAGKDLPANDKGAGYGVFETANVAGVLALAGLGSIAGYRLAFLVAAGVAVLGGLVTALLGDARKASAAERSDGVR